MADMTPYEQAALVIIVIGFFLAGMGMVFAWRHRRGVSGLPRLLRHGRHC